MTEKLYYQKPYQKTFSAHVVRCIPDGPHYAVILDRTAFYPEGGGQPCDTGVLNFVNVLDVQEKDGEIVHTTDAPFARGSAVTGGINWARRFRLMQQHTGEHLVSGIAHRLFQVDNVGFHMGEKFLTVDWNGRLDSSQLATVERLANEAVFRNLPVQAAFLSDEQLKAVAYRSKKELQGPVRIVTIPGCDVCACCGTHVAATGEIGPVKILTSQSYKGGTRITMACGEQAMEDYREKTDGAAFLSNLLSAKPEEIPQAAERLLCENADLKRELSERKTVIFELKTAALPETAETVCLFEEGLSADDMRRFATMVASKHGVTAAVLCGGDENGYRYAVASPREDDVRPLGKALNAAFSGRGGGSAELVQGSVRGRAEDIREFFARYPQKLHE